MTGPTVRTSRRAVIALPLAAAVALAACGGQQDPDEDSSASESTNESAGDTEDGSAAPSAAPELPDPEDLGDGVAATVNEQEVPTERIQELADLRGVSLDDEADLPDVRQLLGQVIQVELVTQQAGEELGLDLDTAVDGPAVTARAEEIIESAGGEEAFAASAAQQGVAAEDASALAAENARLQLLIERVQDAIAEDLPDDAVDEDEVRTNYEEDPAQFRSSDVAHILFGPEDGTQEITDEQYEQFEQQARDALDRLDDGEDFGALARELSTGPTGPDGGELGTAEPGDFVPAFEDAIYADGVEDGDVLGPVRTRFGVHLIRVNEVITPSIDEVLADAREQAAAIQFQQFAGDALAAGQVVVDDDYGVWDATTSTVVAPDGA